MSIDILVVLLCWSALNIIHGVYGYECHINQKRLVGEAFNVGRYVYLGQGSKMAWEWDTRTKRVSDRPYNQNIIFGKGSFNWLHTAISFDFAVCDRSDQSASYCQVVDSAKSLVIGVGSRHGIAEGTDIYGYITYRLSPDGKSLTPIDESDGEMLWGLSRTGTLLGDFWPKTKGKLYCESGLFVRSRHELLLSVFDGNMFSDEKFRLMSRKFESDGKWADDWTPLAAKSFKGMFEIDGRVFGFDKKNTVYEFNWIDDRNVTFEAISSIKELVNCFGNSSLNIDENEIMTSQPKTITSVTAKTTVTTTTTTTTTTMANTKPISNENDRSHEHDMNDMNAEEMATKELFDDSETTVDYEFIPNANNSQNSTQLKELIDKVNIATNKPVKELTPFYVFAIILIFIVIAILVVVVIRRKSMTREWYINSRTDDMKSAEIPLNNNNKNSNSKDV
ncbi:unnamed protein product [Medioppia subpectinata]|uniref:Uncharacterized protein n=1 Tax=Medioppia subpectinata TaxID=1979941 RepID=A0A7R9QEY8_9ACAR|nr:unnamed protein product [Medioppia subpectinata]CAG2119501.1 unnamed protein product [Medioppia subpectinata]